MAEDGVLAAWAPAGWGRVVVVLGEGVVVHKAVVSGKAAAVGVAGGERYGSPFIEKVLSDGVAGLLASPRMTLLRWDEISSAEYRKLMFGRARMTVRARKQTYKLKFLQNTYIAGDPQSAFAHHLAERFTTR